MKLLKKVLVINRGEIACRIIQACQELGVKAVAIYSDVDQNERHVDLADEAVALSGTSASETYLNILKLIEIAKKTNCDAIHPGYGFLSERSEAAEAFLKAKIQWIGPRPKSINLLGNKLEAKKLLENYKVPTLPWGEFQDAKAAKKLIQKIGLPVLLKAAGGGGGKGMRLLREEKDLVDAISSASREALASFGDATILIEKYLEKPRHIEVQILGDTHGNIMHLGERECSLQRRHQKVIEEAPAPNLKQSTREALWQTAIKIAKSVNYENAGTLEFLVDQKENFYFLEMNSRLQVEHSVTEAVWGVDLVQAQIKVASGFTLDEIFPQRKHLFVRGHAMETRIYAEDAAKQFAPSPGKLLFVEWPQGPGIRLDSGIKQGSEISLNYDAMIAKVTCIGSDRQVVIDRLCWALQHTVIFGVTTNINYLQDILQQEPVQKGKMHVQYLEKEFAPWKDELPKNIENILKNAAEIHSQSLNKHVKVSAVSPWEST